MNSPGECWGLLNISAYILGLLDHCLRLSHGILMASYQYVHSGESNGTYNYRNVIQTVVTQSLQLPKYDPFTIPSYSIGHSKCAWDKTLVCAHSCDGVNAAIVVSTI